MHKLFTLGLALLVTTGCDINWASPNFDYQSTLYQSTRGVALHDASPSANLEDPWSTGNDAIAQVGINGTTCEVETRYASMSTDYDYPGSDESVDDIGEDANGDVTVVVTSEKGVHLQKSDGAWYAASEDYEVPNAEQSRIFGDGAAVLHGNDNHCGVAVVGVADPSDSYLKPEMCDGPNTLSVDPVAGTIFVGSGAGVFTMTPDGAVQLDEQAGEVVEWDASADVLYVGEYGGYWVRALEADGSERWAAELEGTILDLEDMGPRAQVAIAIALPSGQGDLVVLDGFTGEYITDLTTPAPAVSVSTSSDGQSLALEGDEQVHFYGVSSFF